MPGDKILLKRGSVFTGQQLAFQGMGAKGKPIEIALLEKANFPGWKEMVRWRMWYRFIISNM